MNEQEQSGPGAGPEKKSEGSWEDRLQALYAAADPQGEPSDALVQRISDLRARYSAPSQRKGRDWLLRRPARAGSPLRTWSMLPVVRWGVAVFLAVALISIWPANRRDGGVVEAALRASAAAPALHVVGRGTSENQELWYRQGVGVYLYGKNPKFETILVDDLRHQYRYEIRERCVYVTRSLMADPSGVALFWANHSGAGMLKQMLQAWGPESVSVESVTREGRTLRRLVGPRRVTKITIDPETDRILAVDVDLPHPGSTDDWTRYDFDYPDPATVDRGHFQFHLPPGVAVVDQTARR
jgi:hypothetical protein